MWDKSTKKMLLPGDDSHYFCSHFIRQSKSHDRVELQMGREVREPNVASRSIAYHIPEMRYSGLILASQVALALKSCPQLFLL